MGRAPQICTEGTSQGWDALIYILPFPGGSDGLHHFDDHKHARNFLRYLFSLSFAHPTTPDTCLNLVTEFDGGGPPCRAEYNVAPERMMEDFQRRRFPERDAHLHLADDGAYVLFFVRAPDGQAWSNFITTEGNEIFVENALLDELVRDFIPEQDLMAAANRAGIKGPISDFGELKDRGMARRIELIVHRLTRLALGNTDRVILSVTHRDQQIKNPSYHLHRLLDFRQFE